MTKLKHIILNLLSYFDKEERRLVFQSIVIGVVVWAIVFALRQSVEWLFHFTLSYLEELETGVRLLLVLVPLLAGAALVAAITRYRAAVIHYRDSDGRIHELNDVEGDGLERAISLYYSSEPTFDQVLKGQDGVEARWQLPTFTLAAKKFLATLITLGSGGSGGLEASVTLIGESTAAGLFKPRFQVTAVAQKLSLFDRIANWWRATDPDDLQTAQLSGIAAAVSVLLGAPFAAAFFATEVMYRKRPIIEKLLYSLLAALVAFFLTHIFAPGKTAMFEVEKLFVPPATLAYYLDVIVMSALIALVGIFFGKFHAWGHHTFYHRLPVAWQRHLTGAAITGFMAIGVVLLVEQLRLGDFGLELVLGTGESVVNAALAGKLTLAVALIALAAKMPATIATVGSGGSAGLLVPSLFFGTMVAAGMADFLGIQPMWLIVPGMTAALVSIVNVPLAAILFSVEIFGSAYMIPSLIALVVTSLLAHNQTIYRSQRQKYSQRQIMPGVSSRRVQIPPAWWGQTLVDLDFRNRFDLNVVGLLERHDESGAPRVRLDVSPMIPLEAGDVLVVLGRDEKLDALEAYLRDA